MYSNYQYRPAEIHQHPLKVSTDFFQQWLTCQLIHSVGSVLSSDCEEQAL